MTGKLKLLLVPLVFVGLFFGPVGSVEAVTEAECHDWENKENWDEAEKCWRTYFGAKKNTLKNEIDSKTVQIDLTTQKIVATQQNIAGLEEDISQLSGRIADLDFSLDELSAVLIRRIAETYKKGRPDPLTLFLASHDFSEFIGRYKYVRVAQAHDREIILAMEKAKYDYEGQKDLKEEKQLQLENWQTHLAQEKAVLDQAVRSKQLLLRETEASYQRTLARIQAEKQKIAGVSLFGRPAEFRQWPGDNHYFNQADSRWAMLPIGGGVYGPSYMWEWGCAVTSMAMVLHKWGAAIDPGILSQSPIYRADLIAWQDVPGPGGFGGTIQVKGHGYGGIVSWEQIDTTLNAGNWVIVYVSGVGHYVVLLNKDGDDYRMHDPYFGPNLSFNERYLKGAVDEMIIYFR
jgi:hypothetical protein